MLASAIMVSQYSSYSSFHSFTLPQTQPANRCSTTWIHTLTYPLSDSKQSIYFQFRSLSRVSNTSWYLCISSCFTALQRDKSCPIHAEWLLHKSVHKTTCYCLYLFFPIFFAKSTSFNCSSTVATSSVTSAVC